MFCSNADDYVKWLHENQSAWNMWQWLIFFLNLRLSFFRFLVCFSKIYSIFVEEPKSHEKILHFYNELHFRKYFVLTTFFRSHLKQRSSQEFESDRASVHVIQWKQFAIVQMLHLCTFYFLCWNVVQLTLQAMNAPNHLNDNFWLK